MAAAAIPLAIKLGGLASSIGLSQLTQHTARLHAAQNENAALAGVVGPFDLDFKAIVDAYNNGDAPASVCIAALQQVDQNIYNQLRSGTVAPGGGAIPGTAWSDAVGFAGKCNKQCTAGCCVYFGDLGPPLSLAQVAMGGQGGRWKAGDPRYKAISGGAVVTVPQVFSSKYGGTSRPLYTVTIKKPAALTSVHGQIRSTVNSLLSTQPNDPLGAIIGAQSGITPAGGDLIPGSGDGPLGTIGGGSLLGEGISNTTLLLVGGGAAFFLLFLAILLRR